MLSYVRRKQQTTGAAKRKERIILCIYKMGALTCVREWVSLLVYI